MAEKTKEKDETEIKAEVEAPKTVKVKVMQAFINNRTRLIEAPGAIAEVFATDVPELTRDFGGQYAFRGERYSNDGDVKRNKCVRAELIQAA